MDAEGPCPVADAPAAGVGPPRAAVGNYLAAALLYR